MNNNAGNNIATNQNVNFMSAHNQIDIITIQDMQGHDHLFPCIQLELNAEQQCMVIGGIHPDNAQFIEITDHPGFESVNLGMLDEQHYVFQMQMINSLNNYAWDFTINRNPLIILINKK